ncbi:MAG TPA: ImmA/IrrE family metallo-endopeptidase [Myxococcales bacterium]|jgi:Zn-dependent peptidase ImmA (M78 family)|nr:ImmA/IrrE family metallo-endopeptidase [Myxococcales bacterium]
MNFGSAGGLSFRLAWSSAGGSGTAAEVTTGRLEARIGSRLVWGHATAESSEGFSWSWVELLEHLAQHWSYLQFEELDPLRIQPAEPSRLRALAVERWEDLPQKVRDREEESLWAFEESHNLAFALHGASLPPLWVLRSGVTMLVSSTECSVRESAASVLETLEALGQAVASRLGDCGDPRSKAARSAWMQRSRRSPAELVPIATGLPPEDVTRIQGEQDAAAYWELSADWVETTELMAVARMLGGSLSTGVVRQVLQRVRLVGRSTSAKLDRLTAECPAEELLKGAASDWEQGYRLASWFRGKVKAPDRRAVPIEALLKSLGVQIAELPVTAPDLDAVACWGPRHGPAVLINLSGRLARTPNGRRTTLAHEICHLLVDRAGALPLAEALGGDAPRPPERRANAFAAEMLLPRAAAASALAAAQDPRKATDMLIRRYQVSGEVVAWQAYNSQVTLPPSTLRYLRRLVREKSRFVIDRHRPQG